MVGVPLQLGWHLATCSTPLWPLQKEHHVSSGGRCWGSQKPQERSCALLCSWLPLAADLMWPREHLVTVARPPAETWHTRVAVRSVPFPEDKSCHLSSLELPNVQGMVWK